MADVTLEQKLLGLRPYFLVEMAPDPDDPEMPLLHVSAGGGAEEDLFALPLLALTSGAPEGNPIAEMLRRVYHDGNRPLLEREILTGVVQEFNPDWLAFVTQDAV